MINYVNDEGLATAAAEIKSRIGSSSASAGGLHIGKYVDEQVNGCVSVSTLPYGFSGGSAVVLNNELHILGSSGSRTNHYKYNGTSWGSVSTLPYDFYNGSAVVYHSEIHILSSGNSSYYTSHYKYDGNSWVNVSTLPGKTSFNVVCNNEIHGAYDLNHYIVRPDKRHIATLLPKGAHILLPQNETTIFTTDNANIEAPNIVKMTESGIVEILAELPNLDDESYLTFY